MGRIDDKLNSIFNDEEADDILGGVKPKRSCRRSPSAQIEKNFREVIAFFEKHGRLPTEDSDDGGELGLWAKFDGIRIRDELRAQVGHMDKYGLLDMEVGKNEEKGTDTLELEVPDTHFDETCVNAINTYIVLSESALDEAMQAYRERLSDIDKECEHNILVAHADTIRPLRERLAKLVLDISAETFNLEGAEETGTDVTNKLKSTAKALTELASKLQVLSECIGTARNRVEKENAEHRAASKATKDEVAKPILLGLSSHELSSTDADKEKAQKNDSRLSLEEILADDDFDDLLDGNDDFDSDRVLGGHRATRTHERENVDQTNREPCPSFESYRERFEQYKQAMQSGALVVSTSRHENLAAGDLFLWDGLIALLTGESIKGDIKEHSGKRLHVVFSNGTEAWLREGSIRRSMYVYAARGNKVMCKRLVPVSQELFTADESSSVDENAVTGHIYVARTLSKDPGLANIRKNSVKIGVTKNPVAVRVANAEKDPTFLCAPVDVVSTFTLHNLVPRKVEDVLHAFFGRARLKINAKDRFNNSVSANEWFIVAPQVVEQAVKHLVDGRLNEYTFDEQSGKIQKRG